MSTKWEYLTYIFNVGASFLTGPQLDGQAFTNKLNEYGQEGWELVSLMDMKEDEGRTACLMAVFKRHDS